MQYTISLVFMVLDDLQSGAKVLAPAETKIFKGEGDRNVEAQFKIVKSRVPNQD